MLWWTLRQLKSKDPLTRGRAVLKLGESKDPVAFEALLMALNDNDEGVRGSAVDRLAKWKDPRTFEALLTALKDNHHTVRMNAAYALGCQRVYALADTRDVRAVESLVAALKDKHWYVRRAAALSLRFIGDVQACEPLAAALKDENVDVRKTARDSLTELGWRAPVLSIIVFRSGAVQPQNPLDYAKQIVAQKYQCDATKIEVEKCRIVGVRDELDADSARSLYVQLKASGSLPYFGPLDETFEGKGPDGRRVVAFLFGGIAAKGAPRKPIKAIDDHWHCTSCGSLLQINPRWGESIFSSGATLSNSQPTGKSDDDYALFRGSVCFNCRAVLCTDCLGERVDQCPTCKGGTKPAYRRYLRELSCITL